MEKLFTRDEFREGVFKRDSYKCVICGNPAKDAHHILERRLWGDTGGYYLSNGASLCEEHHIAAEETTLSCEDIRKAAKIEKVILPEHLYDDYAYDKWGNVILPTGMRLKGELFHDESVQKILKQGNVLDRFTKYVKYPRTWHLPFSPGLSKDDRVMPNMDRFVGKRVIVHLKIDGENTTMYNDYLHCRSIDYAPHESRSWAKVIHSRIAHEIPENFRICCENVYAKHSIHYKNLKAYVYAFAIWHDNKCLSWDETKEYCDILGLETCPVIYDGIWDEKIIRSLYREKYDGDDMEGFVVRIADSYDYRDFRYCVGKYVRKNHVQTHAFWLHSSITPNEISK